MILYLVRHAQSLSNTANQVTGSKQDTLSEEGKKQAQVLAIWLRKIGISGARYVTSTWQRAQQTAHILYPDASWHVDARLGETDAGEVAEWPLVKFKEQYTNFYESSQNRYPSGESHEDLNIRVIQWLEDMKRTSSEKEKLVLVTHNGPLTCILQHVIGLSMESFPAFLAPNASLSVVDIPPLHSKKSSRLLAFAVCPDDRLERGNVYCE